MVAHKLVLALKGSSVSVCLGDYIDSVGSNDICERDHLDVELVKKAHENPVPKLKAAQNDNGSWTLNASLASALETTEEELKANIPGQDPDSTVWATILALIWLHATSQDCYDDWEILKATAFCWLRTIQDLPLLECVEAGNTLLGTSVDPSVLEL
ncbi:von Willebrand factor A domain-containing protein 5A-like [Lissotriton helveticus]